MNVASLQYLDLETLKSLKNGDKIVTPYGTGFLERVGSWCSVTCHCHDRRDEDCQDANMPCLRVNLDGGGTCWVDYDKCAKAT